MIEIYATALSYRIFVSPQGVLLGTQFNLERYLRRFNQTTWNQQLRRMVLYRRYVHYVHKTKMLYLPRYDLPDFCQMLTSVGIPHQVIELPLQEGLSIEIKLKPGVKPRNEIQAEAINYLATNPHHLRGLSLLPGMGKTYCTIDTLSRIGRRAIVSVGGLVDQWERAIYDFTELTEKDVYVIRGAPSLTKLLTQIDRNIHPKIILCSLGTMRNYVLDNSAYENYPCIDELTDRLKIGVRVIDEAHLNFWLSLMLDLRTNAKINIALTATFDRTDTQVQKIFHAHYPRDIRHGEEIIDKYVDIYSYSYSLGGAVPVKAYTTPKGYNHSKLEDYLLRRVPTKLEYIYATIYSPAIFANYINAYKPGEKLLILCATVAMCEWFRKRLEQDLPNQLNLKFATYVSETEDAVLADSDVILSTVGSAGTGTDIKNLKMVMMTIATSSNNTNRQTLGRLRKPDNGDTPVYVYTWCRDFQPHQNYQTTRKSTFTFLGKTFSEVDL